MSNECVISFLFENSKTVEKHEILEYQARIQLALNSLDDTYGFEFKNPIQPTADATNQQEISVKLSVLKPNVMRDDIFLVISQLQERLSDLPVAIRLVSDDIQQSEFSCRDMDIEVNKIYFGIIQDKRFLIYKALDPEHHGDFLNQCRKRDKFWPESWDAFIVEYAQQKRSVFRFDCIHEKMQLIVKLPMKDHGERERRFKRMHDDRGQREKNAAPEFELPALPGVRHEYNEVNIKMIYENVMRMSMEVTRCDDDEVEVMLFIHYRHCPSVFIRPWDIRERKYRMGSRYINWSEDFTVENFLEEMFHSSVMALSLRISHDSLTQLFCQLRDLVQCKIEFRRFDQFQPPDYYGIPQDVFESWPFEIRYLIDAILSTGHPGKYRLLRSWDTINGFIKFIDVHLRQRRNDELIKKLTKMFFEIIQDIDIVDNTFRIEGMGRLAEKDKSFENVRKVVITPTRILLFPPEPVMGSRIVRKVGADRILRVVIRDDTMDMMRDQTCPPYVIRETVQYYLQNQLEIAGEMFYFLGYSNSQLRDHGCYFLRADSKDEVINLLKEMGDFKNEGVAKTMARFAQCFTQSRVSEIELNPGNCAEIPDIESCAKDGNGKPYCFSDGVGLISDNHAKKLIRKLKIENNPGCFQFRCGGYKGVLSVDPLLDRQQQWLRENGFDKSGDKTMKCDVLFRPSQNKFTSKLDNNLLEIVKHSTPVPMRLNKPLINIYDQVSEKQGDDLAIVIKKRMMELVSDHISGILRSLTEDVAFREALMDVPVYAPINKMPSYSTLVDEPFFRSMVIARAKSSLKLLSEKKQINIPSNLGRCMFGIVDPYGILQYGQVFVQYSKNLSQDSRFSPRVILKGRVAISKNPMCNSGDLRMFDAIDVPALRHYVDIVVFPQYGPRPHPDEMAGSDLDGDEYSLIWDPELLLKYSEPAFNYTPPKPCVDQVELENLIHESTEFFIKYMSMDMIGQIANAHLMNSDLYGLDSLICENIAKKQMLAVDFAKTGVPMDPLTRSWNDELPPERAERHPDFMQKDYAPTYESPRLLGRIHRKIARYYEVMNSIMTESEVETIEKHELDPFINIRGWEDHSTSVKDIHDKYCIEIDQLMVAYGVVNEGELFSQHFTVLKQRLNNREADNMAGFTTATLIQAQVFSIFTRYRQEFFDYFSFKLSSDEQKEIIRERVNATPEMKKRAVAYYKTAYTSNYYLSFAWLVWDIIDQVRLEKRLPIKMDAIGERISNEIHMKEFTKFDVIQKGLQKTCPAVIPYLERYDGLGKLLYFVIKWMGQQHFLDSINKPKICLLFVQFALGVLPRPKGFYPFLEETTEDNQHDKRDLRSDIGGLGRKLIWFFSTLGSDEFFRMKDHDYSKPNLGPNKAVYEREQWIALHDAGLVTYLNIACKIYSSVLLPFNPDGTSSKNLSQIVKPKTAFVVEVPTEMTGLFVGALPKLEKLSGCVRIAYQIQEIFRTKNLEVQNPNTKISLWPRGTPTQIQQLRKMLTVRPELIPNESPKETAERIGKLMIEKVTQIIQSFDE